LNIVHALADEVLQLQSQFDPLNATMLGIPGYDDRLADPSDAAERQQRDRAGGILARARRLEAMITHPEDRVTVAVIAQQAEALVDKIDSRMVESSVTDNNYVGPAARLLSLMPVVALPDRERVEAYLNRLRAVPAHLDAVADRHLSGAAAGRVPVRRLADASVAHLDRYLADPAADPLLGPNVGADRAAERDRLLADVVRPAYARYRAVLVDKIVPHARPDDRPGLCWLPGGHDTYAMLTRLHTTTERSPDDLHQVGLDLAEQLRAEYADLGGRLFGTEDQAEIFARMAGDPAMRWRDGDELLADAQQAMVRAEAALPGWFGLVAGQPCEVRSVPAVEAPGAPAAYYFQPTLDGSRPGVYFANTHRAEERGRFLSEVTAFHEGVPGHHLQLTVAIERTDLPLLRRLCDVNATIEGWALYSERLADEMGLYSGDVARLGMLTMDSMRAARLTVDTGLHAMGWSREQALAYLRKNAPLTEVEIAAEVDRYIAYAGQALSYMVGRLEIVRIRAAAEARLRSRFDIRAFHDVLLGSCPLPLNVLDRVMSGWSGLDVALR
jgi:uncharacterized protein (DUF885 family)